MVSVKNQLEIILSKLKRIEKPKVELEQYETPSNLVSYIVNELLLLSLIENKKIIEPACGNARFSLALSFFNPEFILAFDIDKDVIKIAKENYENLKKEFNLSKIYFVIADAKNLKLKKKFDLCIMNPPFGIQGKIKDLEFLDFASKISNFICSINPNGKNKEFFTKFLAERNFSILKIKEEKFPIERIFWFHKKEKKYVDVVIIFAKHEDTE